MVWTTLLCGQWVNTVSFIPQWSVIQGEFAFEEIFVVYLTINGLILPIIKERWSKQGKQKLYEVVKLSFVSSFNTSREGIGASYAE